MPTAQHKQRQSAEEMGKSTLHMLKEHGAATIYISRHIKNVKPTHTIYPQRNLNVYSSVKLISKSSTVRT